MFNFSIMLTSLASLSENGPILAMFLIKDQRKHLLGGSGAKQPSRTIFPFSEYKELLS